MKFSLVLSAILVSSIMFSCGESGDKAKSKVDPDGPELEVTVESFDSENNKTVLKVTNRNEESIKSIRGRLQFMDSSGENLMTATGRIIDSPFQKAQNPQLVKSMGEVTFELMNEIPENTEKIVVTEVSAELEGGGKVSL